MLVAGEMISFVRLLIRRNSRVREDVLPILHGVFGSGRDCALCGLFAILGREIVPYQMHGWVVDVSQTRVLKLTSCEQCQGFLPASRVSPTPADFVISDSEAAFLAQFAKSRELTLEKRVLVAHFYGFLAVCLQSPENMRKFLVNGSLDPFIELALSPTGENRPVSLAVLTHNIAQCVLEIAGGADADCPVQFVPVSPRWQYSMSFGLHIANIALRKDTRIYFELNIVEIETPGFAVGFLDADSDAALGSSELRCWGIDFRSRTVLSPMHSGTVQIPIIAKGDYVGIGCIGDAIFFTVNGGLLPVVLPLANFTGNLLPFVDITVQMQFESNFGELPFKANLGEFESKLQQAQVVLTLGRPHE
jgi:hypothetical protein